MRVFVTGGTGFVGSVVVQELLQNGHEVLGLARGDASDLQLAREGAQSVRGTIDDLDTLKAATEKCDAVVHLAFSADFSDFAGSCARDRAAIEIMGNALVEKATNKSSTVIPALVITSGTLALKRGELGDEDQEIDATSEAFGPLALLSDRMRSESLALSFAKKGIRASVVRLPPTTHGAGMGESGFLGWFTRAAIASGKAAYVGAGENHWSAGHRRDAAKIYRLALEKAEPGSIFHASSEHGLCLKNIAAEVGKALGVPTMSVPAEKAAEHFGPFAVMVTPDNLASSAKTKERLGWEPPSKPLRATRRRSKAEVQEVSIPKPREGYVLIKVAALALNPIDWKQIDFLATPGPGVENKQLKKGMRVAGMAHGANAVEPEDGAFGEYCTIKATILIPVPDNWSDVDASTLPTAINVVCQALYYNLQLPLPVSSEAASEDTATRSLLIYGGSSAMGTMAIQYARLSGFTNIVATCSKSNADMVKSFGATAVFDYYDSECAAQIREYTHNNLALAMDCIATESSTAICEAAMGSNGGTVTSLMPCTYTRKDITAKSSIGYFTLGEPFHAGAMVFPADFAQAEFATKFFLLSAPLVAQKKIRAHPIQLGQGGLQGVLEGLQTMREGKVSGKKLVYQIA